MKCFLFLSFFTQRSGGEVVQSCVDPDCIKVSLRKNPLAPPPPLPRFLLRAGDGTRGVSTGSWVAHDVPFPLIQIQLSTPDCPSLSSEVGAWAIACIGNGRGDAMSGLAWLPSRSPWLRSLRTPRRVSRSVNFLPQRPHLLSSTGCTTGTFKFNHFGKLCTP
jgi:hypothetical protein